MKKSIITLSFSFLAAIFIMACTSKTSENKKDNPSTEQSDIATYQCSMKCEGDKTYDKPGQCPVCNMDLGRIEEKGEVEEHDHGH